MASYSGKWSVSRVIKPGRRSPDRWSVSGRRQLFRYRQSVSLADGQEVRHTVSYSDRLSVTKADGTFFRQMVMQLFVLTVRKTDRRSSSPQSQTDGQFSGGRHLFRSTDIYIQSDCQLARKTVS